MEFEIKDDYENLFRENSRFNQINVKAGKLAYWLALPRVYMTPGYPFCSCVEDISNNY